MNSRLHPLAAMATVAVLVVGLSACSSDDDKKASSETSASPSSGSSPVSAEEAAMFTTVADAQAEAGSTHVVMVLGAAGQEVKAAGDLVLGQKADSPEMSVDVEMAGNKEYSLSMILLDRALFVNLGQMTGGKYGEIDLADKADESIAIQFTPLAEQLDPVKQLKRLVPALKSVEKKGEPTTIDGVRTEPYEVTVEAKKMSGMENQPEDAPKTLTYTLFVGPDQLVRRIVTGSADSKVQADYTQWGEPVKIKAPRSSQISDTALDQLRSGS